MNYDEALGPELYIGIGGEIRYPVLAQLLEPTQHLERLKRHFFVQIHVTGTGLGFSQGWTIVLGGRCATSN